MLVYTKDYAISALKTFIVRIDDQKQKVILKMESFYLSILWVLFMFIISVII